MKWLSAAFVALAMAASPAVVGRAAPDHVIPNRQAAAQCAPLDIVLGMLAQHYGERVFWWGQTAGHVTMIVTERPDTRTWTLLAVYDGLACMVGSGGTAGAVGS